MDEQYTKASLELHKKHAGKLCTLPKVNITDRHIMGLAYSPGVAAPSIEIHKNKENAYIYTMKGNSVAVISNGTSVLGLGDVGPDAAMPVMEGKSVIFKTFADIDSFPLCVNAKDNDDFIKIVKSLECNFGGINLEDIKSPDCVYIEEALCESMDIPVFHDDQHGTAVVAIAALKNACKVVKKDIKKIKVLVNGTGAAGASIIKLLNHVGVSNIVALDKNGPVDSKRNDLDYVQKGILNMLSPCGGSTLIEAIEGADVFIGVSAPKILRAEHIKKMASDPIIFAMANPTPEIMPEDAMAAGAAIIGTGRSDFHNQINNMLAFPGIFRGALDVRSKKINIEMKLAAVEAIASAVDDSMLSATNIIPSGLDSSISKRVAAAVRRAAIETGVARIQYTEKE